MLNAKKPAGGDLKIKLDELTNVSVVQRQSRFINLIRMKLLQAAFDLNLHLTKLPELKTSKFAFCSKYL